MTNSDEMPTLLPCPFCGLVPPILFNECKYFYHACSMSHVNANLTESNVRDWNTRPIESKLEQEITRLKERLEYESHTYGQLENEYQQLHTRNCLLEKLYSITKKYWESGCITTGGHDSDMEQALQDCEE